MLKSANNHQGISMIEAILAVAVLTIGILVIVTLFPFALKISKSSEQETIAADLAQAKIEEIFSLGYNDISNGIVEARHHLASDPQNPFYDYERQTVVQLVNGNLANSATDLGLKKVTVTVFYKTPMLNSSSSLPVSIIISQK